MSLGTIIRLLFIFIYYSVSSDLFAQQVPIQITSEENSRAVIRFMPIIILTPRLWSPVTSLPWLTSIRVVRCPIQQMFHPVKHGIFHSAIHWPGSVQDFGTAIDITQVV